MGLVFVYIDCVIPVPNKFTELCSSAANLLPSEEQMRPAVPREISGFTSHDRINTMGGVYTPVHALMNNTWRCTVFNRGNLSEASVNVVVSKSTENIDCSFGNSDTKSNYIHCIFLHTNCCYFSILKGGMVPDNVSDNSPWASLTERLAHITLMPYDVGGSGDCFSSQFRTSSMDHQTCTFKFE